MIGSLLQEHERDTETCNWLEQRNFHYAVRGGERLLQIYPSGEWFILWPRAYLRPVFRITQINVYTSAEWIILVSSPLCGRSVCKITNLVKLFYDAFTGMRGLGRTSLVGVINGSVIDRNGRLDFRDDTFTRGLIPVVGGSNSQMDEAVNSRIIATHTIRLDTQCPLRLFV